MAFQAAARGAFLEGYLRAKPVILEPIMKVVVETPTEFLGAVMGLLNQRRGTIVGSQEEGSPVRYRSPGSPFRNARICNYLKIINTGQSLVYHGIRLL